MTDILASAPLTRQALARRMGTASSVAPVRIVHLGLGAFARGHQARYTALVDPGHAWGIAGFTGRSAAAASVLAPQDGLYSLIERSAVGDVIEIVDSIVEVADGANVLRLVELVASSDTAVITLTITESGYRLRADGTPDPEDVLVAADLELVRRNWRDLGRGDGSYPQTALVRLLVGLEARRRAGAGPIAVVPCDNIPDNGAFVRAGLLALARSIEDGAAAWIETHVSFVSTSVDRITPRATPADVLTVAARTGWQDAAPVVVEPFTDWVLSGEFPAGRPAWELAGARFVDDIGPFERRKLWLLNGAHSLLAYAGLLRGFRTVAEAIADPSLRAAVDAFWDEAVRHLPGETLDLDGYRRALLDRFDNARIEHRLDQIAAEGVTKLRVRFADVVREERAGGRSARAAALAVGAWIALVMAGRVLVDAHRHEVEVALAATDPVPALVALVAPELAEDVPFVATVRAAVHA